ncbi:MAG: hypothetical protein IKB31_02975 [Bacteroidaceae bacterium]|nr:hypothetical protein [Bacteroidaceae bacterium]
MKVLNNLISKVGYDKVAHFAIAGWLVSAASAYGFKWMAIVFVCVMLLSVIKEALLDEKFDWGDIVSAALGMFVSLILYIPWDSMDG